MLNCLHLQVRSWYHTLMLSYVLLLCYNFRPGRFILVKNDFSSDNVDPIWISLKPIGLVRINCYWMLLTQNVATCVHIHSFGKTLGLLSVFSVGARGDAVPAPFLSRLCLLMYFIIIWILHGCAIRMWQCVPAPQMRSRPFFLRKKHWA